MIRSVRAPGSSPKAARASAIARGPGSAPAWVKARRTIGPTSTQPWGTPPCTLHAVNTHPACLATTRLALPGTASRLTSAIGTPSERAAATAGAHTNPPIAIRVTAPERLCARIARLHARTDGTQEAANRNAGSGRATGGIAGIGVNGTCSLPRISASTARPEHSTRRPTPGSMSPAWSAIANAG